TMCTAYCCFLLHRLTNLRHLHSFPTRRSSDLTGLLLMLSGLWLYTMQLRHQNQTLNQQLVKKATQLTELNNNSVENQQRLLALQDRKSTRLNSSHVSISYAVFCLKKKKKLPTL